MFLYVFNDFIFFSDVFTSTVYDISLPDAVALGGA